MLTDVDECGCTRGLYGHHRRVCTESWLWLKNLLPHLGIDPHVSKAPGFSVGRSTNWTVPVMLKKTLNKKGRRREHLFIAVAMFDSATNVAFLARSLPLHIGEVSHSANYGKKLLFKTSQRSSEEWFFNSRFKVAYFKKKKICSCFRSNNSGQYKLLQSNRNDSKLRRKKDCHVGS